MKITPSLWEGKKGLPHGTKRPNIPLTNMKMLSTILVVVGLAGVPAAMAQSCCGGRV